MTMIRDDHDTEVTCTRSRKQLFLEVQYLKEKLLKTTKEFQEVQERMRQQRLLFSKAVLTMHKRLQEKDDIIESMNQEREQMIHDVQTSLFLLEADLKREQKEIMKQLERKDQVIEDQKKEIEKHQKQRLPYFIGAKKSLRRSFKTSVILTQNGDEETSDLQHESDDSGCAVSPSGERKADHDSEENLTISTTSEDHEEDQQGHEGSNDDNELFVPCRDKLSVVEEGVLEQQDNISCKTTSDMHGSYERLTDMFLNANSDHPVKIFANHRSVTKPKDVKLRHVFRVHTRYPSDEIKVKSWPTEYL